jgi:hypothetical protein
MTTLVDVSSKFVCKPRWKSPATGVLESVGVLDVYFTGSPNAVWIADNIVTVEAFVTAGRTVVFGSDIQDLCTLGWAITGTNVAAWTDPTLTITKPDGTTHSIWERPMGWFHSCESLALAQRDVLGIALATGPDPLSTV